MSIHINAKAGEVSEIVLLPGDPLRAEFIAANLLTDTFCYSKVRGMPGFTGYYKGLRVSIQGVGMGIPSASIYIHELVRDFKAKVLIRVGTCGAIHALPQLNDLILPITASTDAAFIAKTFGGMNYAPSADFGLLQKAAEIAATLRLKVHIGNVLTSDIFYHADDVKDPYEIWKLYGTLAVEMETAALYTLAAYYKIRALSILTVTDQLYGHKHLTPQEREQSTTDMALVALETATQL